MATCAELIQADLNSGSWANWPAIVPGVNTPFSSNITTKTMLYLYTSKSESIAFDATIASPPGRMLSLAIFKINSSHTLATAIGTVNTTESAVIFQKDLSQGEYVICFSSAQQVNGTIKAAFAGYVSEPRLFPKIFAESSMFVDLKITAGNHDSNLKRSFTLVEGELPPGYELQKDGSIRGKIDNLDEKTEADYAPSINWFYDDVSGRWVSMPRRWTFKVRVVLTDFPQAWDEEWFTLDIHNNWDKDKAAFLLDGPGFDRMNESVERIQLSNPLHEFQPCCPGAPVIETVKATLAPLPVAAPTQTNADIIKDVVDKYENTSNDFIRNFINKVKQTDKYTKLQDAHVFTELVWAPEDRLADHIDTVVLDIGNDQKSNHMPLLAVAETGECMMIESLSYEPYSEPMQAVVWVGERFNAGVLS